MKRSPRKPAERHYSGRVGWLRAAVLGANDGIVSTASLMVGMAAAEAGHQQVLLAGLAGLVGGAMSMAAGEYVSVSSQADTEAADLARERWELERYPEGEHRELAAIYVKRGLSPELAEQVATQLSARDALATHAREELGITDAGAKRLMKDEFKAAENRELYEWGKEMEEKLEETKAQLTLVQASRKRGRSSEDQTAAKDIKKRKIN